MSDLEATLKSLLKQRIMILDGAMGTMVQQYKLQEADFRSSRFAKHHKDLQGNNDILVLTQPKVISEIHRQYLEAGSDIIETNTFASTSIAQADYDLESIVYDLNYEAARLARKAADEYSDRTPNKRRFVAGAIGPMNRALSLSPDINDPSARSVTFDQVMNSYAEQIRALMDGGSDILLVETIFDTLNSKAALNAISKVFEERKQTLPVMVSVTIVDKSGRTLSGQTHRRFLPLHRAQQPAQRGHQLLARRQRHAPVHGRPVEDRHHAHQLLSERRPAQPALGHRLRREARDHRRAPVRLRQGRLRERGGRLLRHHPPAHQGHRRSCGATWSRAPSPLRSTRRRTSAASRR